MVWKKTGGMLIHHWLYGNLKFNQCLRHMFALELQNATKNTEKQQAPTQVWPLSVKWSHTLIEPHKHIKTGTKCYFFHLKDVKLWRTSSEIWMNIIGIMFNIRLGGCKVSLTCSGFQLVKEKSCREGQMELFSWERCSPARRNGTERRGVKISAEEKFQ